MLFGLTHLSNSSSVRYLSFIVSSLKVVLLWYAFFAISAHLSYPNLVFKEVISIKEFFRFSSIFWKLDTIFLKSLINKNNVYCEGKNKDRYGRIIAICYANEMNLNSTMVKEGWAIAYRYYSDDYINEEETAKKIIAEFGRVLF